MNPRIVRVLALLSFVLACSTGLAQQGVYVTQGEKGPTFSDKPQAGAKEMKLKPLSVVPAVPVPPPDKKAGAGSPEAGFGQGDRKGGDRRTNSPYRSFSILAPQDNGSIAGDTSTFEVRLEVDPPLALAEGHAFVVRVNGRFVERRFILTDFLIPPEFWEDGYLPANQGMELEASIVDDNGQIVMRAAPVTFRTRQLAVSPDYYRYPGQPAYVPFPIVPGHPERPPRPGSKPKPAGSTSGESRLAVEPKPGKNPPFATTGKDRPAFRKSPEAKPSGAGGRRAPASLETAPR